MDALEEVQRLCPCLYAAATNQNQVGWRCSSSLLHALGAQAHTERSLACDAALEQLLRVKRQEVQLFVCCMCQAHTCRRALPVLQRCRSSPELSARKYSASSLQATTTACSQTSPLRLTVCTKHHAYNGTCCYPFPRPLGEKEPWANAFCCRQLCWPVSLVGNGYTGFTKSHHSLETQKPAQSGAPPAHLQ